VLEDGQWRNIGEDICKSVAAARAKAALGCRIRLEREGE
jgi:hypothetical protein